MAAGRGAVPVQGPAPLPAAGLRGLPRRRGGGRPALGGRDRHRHRGLRHGPDLCDPLLPARLLHRLGHRRTAGLQPAAPHRRGRAADPSLEVSDLQTYAPGTVPVPDPVDDYGNAGYHAENNQPAPEYQGYGAAEETQAYAYGDLQTPHQDPSFQEPSPYQDASLQAPAHYQAEPQQYAAYADPYLGYDHQGEPAPVPAAAQQQQPSYDYGYGDYGSGDHLNGGYGNGDFNGGNFNNGYGGGDYPAGSDDGYGGYGYPTQGQPPQQQPSYYTDYADVPETPPGGVWVPQQRDAGATPPPPPEQPPVPYGYSDETYQQYPQGYYNDRHGTY